MNLDHDARDGSLQPELSPAARAQHAELTSEPSRFGAYAGDLRLRLDEGASRSDSLFDQLSLPVEGVLGCAQPRPRLCELRPPLGRSTRQDRGE